MWSLRVSGNFVPKRKLVMENKKFSIGEIRYGREIGKCGKYNKYIYAACPECGKERWVALRNGEPKYKLCGHCVTAGVKSHNWRGGRITMGVRYIGIRLYPEDFFYPMATKDGYVMEHRLVMAKSLRRNLHPWEIVHHRNHNREDNRIENLQLIGEGTHRGLTILEGKIDRLLEAQKDLKLEIRLLRFENKTLQERI